MGFTDFFRLAAQGNLIPVYREILADFETPVSAFSKINSGPTAFLFESVEGGENWARYSFLGSGAHLVMWEDKDECVIQQGRKSQRIPLRENPLHHVQELLAAYQPVIAPGLPRFVGGAVGYLGYDIVSSFEPIPQYPKNASDFPKLAFLLVDTLLIFDNVAHTIKVVANAYLPTKKKAAVRQAYTDAIQRIDRIIARLKKSPVRPPLKKTRVRPIRFSANMNREHFEKMVLRTKEYIQAGDIVQGVISQRWETTIHTNPLEIYRALRVMNPSPYMYYLRLAGVELVGSSPEVLVRCEEGRVLVRPIAGTRRRGATEQEDTALEQELVADQKERAEHIMLVDLGRNDVGRVVKPGTITISPFMTVERYSHVMHLVSQVAGTLAPGLTAYDVMKACFPAGTVSGAPKVRAMQIIEELEPTRRGPYAGAVGYFSFSGNMDTCINIRTIVIKGNKAYIQAGAGIVADSDPGREYEEVCHKAGAMMRGITMAEQGLE